MRSATARVQRIRDREMKESPVTPLVENPETGEPLTSAQTTVPEADESLQETATNEQVTLEILAEETPLQETAAEIPADTSAQASTAQAAEPVAEVNAETTDTTIPLLQQVALRRLSPALQDLLL